MECDKEIQLIKEWTLNKNAVLNERITLMKTKLEFFIRSQEKKTIELPHGTLKIRKQPDRIEITDMNKFLENARAEMFKVVPESIKPDLNAIKAFIKVSNKIPEGVGLVEGSEEFKLTIRNQDKPI